MALACSSIRVRGPLSFGLESERLRCLCGRNCSSSWQRTKRMPDLILSAISFIFGIIFGSFLNVCIHRLPREESIVRPRSRCPGCSSLIQWYDNIPLLSYLVLGGKCRKCRTRIPFRYFLVELLSGCIWLFFFRTYGLSVF